MNLDAVPSPARRRLLAGVGASLAAGLVPAVARAQTSWPTKPVTIVIGFPPGGGSDLIARLIGQQLTNRHGHPVIVDSKPGASGTIAVSHVSRAPADGHTLLLSQLGIVTTPHVVSKQAQGGVDVLTDLVPVGQVSSGTIALVVNAALPARNAQELVSHLRRNPKTPYASSGVGSIFQFAGEAFRKTTQVDIVHVPYKGSAPLMVDIAGGHIGVGFIDIATGLPYVQSGQARFLGAVQNTRSPLVPELPTLVEQGIAFPDIRTWFGTFAPKGTPAGLVESMNREISISMSAPEVQQRLRGLGDSVQTTGPKEFAAFFRSQYDFYGSLAREFNIRSD